MSEAELTIPILPAFQESLLWDFESGDDTDIDGWSIRDFNKYCEILDINLSEFADIPISDLIDLPFSALIRTRRKEMGYTISELAELIGYEESIIQAIEDEQNDILIVLDVMKQLSMVLCIPFRLLLKKM